MSLQPSHRPKPGFQPPVTGLDRVVRVLLNDVHSRGNQLVEHPRVGRRAVGRGLCRDRASAQRPGEEPPGDGQVARQRKQDVDDLAILIDCPVEIIPLTGDLDVGLVDEPPVARSVAAGPGGLDELGGKPLYPSVDGDVIHGDAALGQQFLAVPVGQAVPQVPANRYRDDLRREPKASKDGSHGTRIHRISLPPPAIDQRNSAPRLDIRDHGGTDDHLRGGFPPVSIPLIPHRDQFLRDMPRSSSPRPAGQFTSPHVPITVLTLPVRGQT